MRRASRVKYSNLNADAGSYARQELGQASPNQRVGVLAERSRNGLSLLESAAAQALSTRVSASGLPLGPGSGMYAAALFEAEMLGRGVKWGANHYRIMTPRCVLKFEKTSYRLRFLGSGRRAPRGLTHGP